MADPAPSVDRLTFVVEARAALDHLLRVLNAFAVLGARVSSVSMEPAPHGQSIRIEASELEPRRAEILRARLQALPESLAVAVVWRAAAHRAAA